MRLTDEVFLLASELFILWMIEVPCLCLCSMLDLRNQLPAFASEAHSDRLSLRHLVHAYIELHKAGYLTGVDSARISSAFVEHAFQVKDYYH